MALGIAPLSELPLSTLPSAGGAGAYTLTAETAAFVITGTAANLEWGRKLTAASGSYVITGGAAGLEVGYEVVAGSGTYTITGGAAGLRATRRLVAESAAFTISGTAASLEAGRVLVAESAAWVITGGDATLTYTPAAPQDDVETFSGGWKRKKRRLTWAESDWEIPKPLAKAVEVVNEAEDDASLIEALDALAREMSAAVQRNRAIVERAAYAQLQAAIAAEQDRLLQLEAARLEAHLAERRRIRALIDAEAMELLALLDLIE